ncbi:RnlA RNA ligase 1 and tail fiber attachment catalyst [Acinetobacter phage Ac42]|uniref:RNA ligase and tail fiber protein attachment catalyst n=1 Tax=Acinetobacter phage Ac42 TaxID=762660 RepID=UPI0001EBCE09|nr:RNA ligase and tail fiber protein attachment catalyst [Acinetobacter phage Ac42]ADI96461.1 RnlA RNA ligase 1 and tail fiber attachment catalyst [Acinetobacter phage Ac42]
MNELYNNLMTLIEPGKMSRFFLRDAVTPFGTRVRMFGYNYASYTDWLLPDALEARGIMFEMDENDQPIRVMARPMEKFFNLGENPFTIDLDLSTIEYFMDKSDGSLISSYVDNDTLFMKSKMSIGSVQAVAARQVIQDYVHRDLHDRVLELAKDGFTCNFEYVAPDNRVVILYPERALVLLNVRNNETGEYVHIEELKRDPVLRRYLVNNYVIDPENFDQDTFVNDIYQMVDIEGYVFRLMTGQHVKIKTEWYKMLHYAKDTINNNEALFAITVAAQLDDVRSLYSDDYALGKINKFEEVFLGFLDTRLPILLNLHKELNGSSRKDYAIKSQTYFKQANELYLFGIFMQMFEGVPPREQLVEKLSEAFMKNYKLFVPPEYDKVVEYDN